MKSKVETFIVVDYNDLNSFITKIYGIDFEIVEDQEMSNDSCITIKVKKEKLLSGDIEELIKRKKDKYVIYILHTLLTDLVNKNLIKEGKYLIKVSW